MKKILLALLICLFLVNQVFAGSATVTKTDWGYHVTGGTSQTLVISGYAWIKGMVFYPGGAATDTATFTSQSTSGAADVVCIVLNEYAAVMAWPGNGIQWTNLKVTLTSTSDAVDIYVSRVSP
jgi:hypothetical protein